MQPVNNLTPSTEQLHALLKKHWGYDQFRPLQLEIVRSILSNQDTLAILPTGGGKSLCYQLPGIAIEGLTLVISPLIALMKDQMAGLNAKGIEAIGIMSGQSKREQDILIDNAAYGKTKFLFLSPERLRSKIFLDRIEKLNISLVAVDEAHCISEWGHDFRPEYRQIADLRNAIPNVKFIALTATATPNVREDIVLNLALKQPNIFTQSPVRLNLSYSVQYSENKKQDIFNIVNKAPGCAIIYVQKRRTAKELESYFKERGIHSEAFHGGIPVPTRNKIVQSWNDDKLQLIIATKAFGMGMDKPNVRTVVHYQPADALEAYVQEAGRAGRDGLKAKVIMLWNKYDIKVLNDNIDVYYPPLDFIRKIYKGLAKFVKIASGLTNYDWLDFNLNDFCRKLKTKKTETFYALNLLHRANIISLSASILHPSKVILHESNTKKILQSTHVSEKMKSFVKIILRNYDGIFMDARNIDESSLAKKAEISKSQVVEALRWLESRDILRYSETFDGHKINFNGFVHSDNKITLDKAIYDNQKTRMQESIGALLNYIFSKECKQIHISRFFGFVITEKCKACDYCVSSDNQVSESFQSYNSKIIKRIDMINNDLDILFRSFDFKEKDQVSEALKYLLDEELISIRGNKIFTNHG